MLDGILRMPPDVWGRNPVDILQRHAIYVEAADRIRELEAALALNLGVNENDPVITEDPLANATRFEWKDRAIKAEARLRELAEAYEIMREASFQSHSGHWDPQRTGGQNCPECIRSRTLREKADSLASAALKAVKEKRAEG
jgi:hypothetical protein